MFCPRTKLRGLAVYEDDSLKDNNFSLNLRMNYADDDAKISDQKTS